MARVSVMLSVVLCFAASAQDRPQKLCNFDGFGADPKLAEVTKATIGYFGCATAKDCIPAKLAAGDAVTPYHTDGDWTCAYLQQKDGAGPGWVKNDAIREVKADPAPPLEAWFGKWGHGDDEIRITAVKGIAQLHLAGDAVWQGGAGVAHTGDFEGDAVPAGNHLHFVEDGPDSCTVDLTLIGKYLVADDNQMCGGMNVRFWGIWKRGK
jgi:hypothetical protein